MYLNLVVVSLVVSINIIPTPAMAMDPQKSDKEGAAIPQPKFSMPTPYYQPSAEEQIRSIQERDWREICEGGMPWLSQEGVEYCYKIGLKIQPNQWPQSKTGVQYLYEKDVIIPIDELPKQKAFEVLWSFQQLGIKFPVEKFPEKRAIKSSQLIREFQLFQEKKEENVQQKAEKKELLATPVHNKRKPNPAFQEEMRELREEAKKSLFQERKEKLRMERLKWEKNQEVLQEKKRALLEKQLRNTETFLPSIAPIDKEVPVKPVPTEVSSQKNEKSASNSVITPVHHEKVIKPTGKLGFQQRHKETSEERKRKELEQKLRNTEKFLASIAPIHKEAPIKSLVTQLPQQQKEESISPIPITSMCPREGEVDEELQRRFERLKAPINDDLSDLQRRFEKLRHPSEMSVQPERRNQEKIRATLGQ